MITKFDKQNLKGLQGEMIQALKQVAERHGLKLGKSGITYEDFDLKFRAGISVTQKSDGEVFDQYREAFKTNFKPAYDEWNPIKSTMLDQTFKYFGKTYKLVGFKPRGRLKPFLATDESGKRYRFPEEVIVEALGVKEPAGLLTRTELSDLRKEVGKGKS